MDPPTVSYPYLRNMMGMSVDDESMKKVPHAPVELYTHVVTKTCEAGSIIGSLVGGGYAVVKKVPVVQSMMTGSVRGLMVVGPLGFLAVFGLMNSIKKKGEVDLEYAYYDRSYRLRHNRNQVRVDRLAYVGSIAGLAVAPAAGYYMLGGACLGLAAGTVTGGVYNAVLAKTSKSS